MMIYSLMSRFRSRSTENRGGRTGKAKHKSRVVFWDEISSAGPTSWSKVELSQTLSLIEAFVIHIDTFNPLQKIFLFWLLKL